MGLSFDFVVLNITGFFAYTVFNVALKYDTYIKDLYIQKYGGDIPIEINDVVFAVHALLMCLVTAGQVLYYPKGKQRVSMVTILITIALWIVMSLFTWLAVAHKFSWLSDIYIFSYVKLAITLIKYIPQAWSNFMRKSTEGWSIGQNLLDLAGGLMSFGQQFVDAINAGDWTIIYGNPVKLGLALISIAFDIIFMSQHYICYRGRKDEDLESSLETVHINGSSTPSSYSALRSEHVGLVDDE
jgi:cystinosin